MAPPQDPRSTRLIGGLDDLLEPFHLACKPTSQFRVGAEAEKIGLSSVSFAPIGYEGSRGVVRVMHELVARHGWAVQGDDHPLLALEKDDASVTLEPGSQLELSGAPLFDLHAVSAQVEAHRKELADVSALIESETGEGPLWFGLGFHPTAKQADLGWVPKPRYSVMREYLPTRGAHGLDMMRRTATVQANFDYENETGAMRALRVGLKTAPFFTAMFACSPFYEGEPFGGKSFRAKVWLDVDPDRQGLLPRMMERTATFRDYVEWALDAPMFLILREGKVVANTGQTFRAFLKDGFSGHRATMEDWVTHLNTLFPEVRLKRTLEVRGGDSQPAELVVAPAALYTGIFYDEQALTEVERLVDGFGYDELAALRREVHMGALHTPFRGRPAGEVAQKLVDAARGGLARRARKAASGDDETVFLRPLAERVEKLRTPADDLLDAWSAHGRGQAGLRAALVEVARI
jgi:glutamate--cysteine ligase